MSYRALATALIAVAVVFFPYWVYITLGLAAIILFPMYWEGIVFGFLADALYGRGVASSALFSPLGFGALAALLIMLPLRDRIRSNG